MRKLIWIFAAALFVLFLTMQFHRPDFNLSQADPGATFQALGQADVHTQSMLQRSCYDCHSTQGKIPWYGHVWPASQLLQTDVRKGRAMLDFSNWDHLSPQMSRIRLQSACQAMRDSEMPLWYYRPMHPGSAPKPEEVEAFCTWAQTAPAGAAAAVEKPRDRTR
jgi:Haem-binding domain